LGTRRNAGSQRIWKCHHGDDTLAAIFSPQGAVNPSSTCSAAPCRIISTAHGAMTWKQRLE
jgi:hypothetical protein